MCVCACVYVPRYSHLAPNVHKGGHVALILWLDVREHHCVADVPGVGPVSTSRGIVSIGEGGKGGADEGCASSTRVLQGA